MKALGMVRLAATVDREGMLSAVADCILSFGGSPTYALTALSTSYRSNPMLPTSG